MGKLLKRESIVFGEQALKRLSVATTDYSTFFEGSPLFVTYYSKNVLKSGNEPTLDDVVGRLESDSPIKYNKIENLPLFGTSGISELSENVGELGLETEIIGEAIIVPSTIDPLENDYFTVPNIGEDYLFRIDKVEHDKITGKQFWRISFHIVMEEVSKIEAAVVEGFEVDYDKLGSTEMRPILSKANANFLRDLDEIYVKAIKIYRDMFYYDELNYLHVNVNDDDIFDPLLTKFIRENDLLLQPDKKDYLYSITLSEILFDSTTTNLYINSIYNASLYNALVESNIDLLDVNYLSFRATSNVIFSSMVNELNFEGRTMVISNYLLGTTYSILDSEFKTKCSSETLYEDTTTYYFENFLINHFNNKLTSDNLLDILGEMDFNYDIRTFVFIPMMLFVLKSMKNSLINL